MTCQAVRDRLAEGDEKHSETLELAAHLRNCPQCAALARRWSLAREALSAPAESMLFKLPDSGFASRVVARLPQAPEALGWAAFRALPAALALVLVLAWLGFSEPPRSADVDLWANDPSPDVLLAYAVLAGGEAP